MHWKFDRCRGCAVCAACGADCCSPHLNTICKASYSQTRTSCICCREIRKYQNTANCLVPRAPVVRLVKEIMTKLKPAGGREDESHPDRIQASAIMALQEGMEIFLVSLFEDANMCAIHAKRVTIMCALNPLCLSPTLSLCSRTLPPC